MSQQGLLVFAAPPVVMVAAGYTDWQVLAILSIALIVGVYRVVITDPPMPMRLAVLSLATGFTLTIFMSPILGRFIANRFGLSTPEGAIIAAFIIAIGWVKAYKMVENSLVDTILKAIVRGVRAALGGEK